MYRKVKTRYFEVAVSGIVTAVILFMPYVSSWAGSDTRRTGVRAGLYEAERPIHPGYPTAFDKRGRINRIATEEVVISDSLYRLSPAVTYHTPARSYTSRTRFHQGDVVGCLMNADGEIESIWLLRSRGR